MSINLCNNDNDNNESIPKEYVLMSHKQLKKQLKLYNLSTNGNKSQLLQRLRIYYNHQHRDSNNNNNNNNNNHHDNLLLNPPNIKRHRKNTSPISSSHIINTINLSSSNNQEV